MPKKTSSKDKENFLRIFRDRMYYSSIRKSCKEANIGKSTFYRWLKECPGFKKEVDKIKERKNDPFKQIKKGNIKASLKFLKKYGKSRGY